MTNSSNESKCPECGAPLEEAALHGLCPKCLLANVNPSPQASPFSSRKAPPSAEDLAPHFPDLEIFELIGVGGMGAVYKARQTKLDRLVALKILCTDLAQDPAFAERFNREARILARLNHPHIVTIFDYGIEGGFSYLLMEYVDGLNLRHAMRVGGFSPADTLSLIMDVSSALQYAHEEGVLHRDIKPENILIDSRGRVKVADFGIAKLTGLSSKDDYTLTFTGSAMGSPHYMAPELFENPDDVDQRADIYSLGVLFYELLTRELPIGRFAAPSARQPMDPRIDEIVMRALEKDRQARYQDAGDVRTGVSAISGSVEPPSVMTGGGGITPPPADAAFLPESRNEPIHWKAALIFAILSCVFTIPTLITLLAGEEKLAVVLSFLWLPFGVCSVVFWAILHHQCWQAIPERFRSISPGKAVGFLFIPFFNFYWAMVTWPKLTQNLDQWQKSMGAQPSRLSGLSITYGILFILNWTIGIIPGIGLLLVIVQLIVFIILYGALVSAINRASGHSERQHS